MSEYVRNSRLWFSSDLYTLGLEIGAKKEIPKDERNFKSGELIIKSALHYLKGGQKYDDLMEEIYNTLYEDYSEWYYENITKFILDNPRPNVDILQYPEFQQYFKGLDPVGFEELQRLVIFLKNPGCAEAIEGIKKKEDDERFVRDSIYLLIPSLCILIATVHGGNFLDKLEEIYNKYELDEEEKHTLLKRIDDSMIDVAASDIVRGKIFNYNLN